MALVLVQLRLAIQRRALGHHGGAQRAFYVAGWVLALLLGLAAGALVDRMASAGDGLGDLALLLILTVIFLGWVLSPILLPGAGDQTVDPERLESFPISPRDQVAGLLLGSLLAPTALFTFLAAAGGTFASGEGVPARILVLLAAVVFTVLCVGSGRAIQAALAGVLRSRRARDIVVALSAALGLGAYLISQSAHNLTQVLVELENNSVEQVLAWLPPGSVGAGMLAARDGDWGSVLLHLALAVLVIVVSMALWGWAIRRRVRGPSGGAARARTRTQSATDLALVPLPLAALPAGPAVAVAAQTLRYFFFRQPRATQSVVMFPIMGVILAHSTIQSADLTTGVVMIALLSMSTTVFNYFGYDDRGFDYLLASGVSFRTVLWGKALAMVALIVGVVAVVAVVEAAINDLWADLVPAILATVTATLIGAGVGAVISVLAPQNRAAPAGGMQGKGAVVLATLIGVAVVFLLVGGLLALFSVAEGISPLLLTALSLPLGVLVAWALIGWAATRAQRDPWRIRRLLLG